MKALLLTGKAQVEYKEIKTPQCPEDGLLIKIESVGLCGSDVRTYFHGHHELKYPQILGHENCGEIVEVGLKTKGYKKGERIIFHPAIPCNKCYYCKKGLHTLCVGEKKIYGSHIPGGFAEYMIIPGIGVENGQILKVPENIKSEEIIIVELLSSIINSQEYANVTLGETVVIIGTGPIGCLQSEIARLRGAKQIIMIDINKKRLEMSKSFSGTHFINSIEEDPISKVMELTDGFGADVVIAANPSVESQAQGLEMLRKRGRLVIFGGVSKDNPYTKFDSNKIHYKEIAILGAYGYSQVQFKTAFDIIVNGMINTKGFVTHTLPLKEMEKGVELIKSGEAIKVVLKP